MAPARWIITPFVGVMGRPMAIPALRNGLGLLLGPVGNVRNNKSYSASLFIIKFAHPFKKRNLFPATARLHRVDTRVSRYTNHAYQRPIFFLNFITYEPQLQIP